MSLDAYRGFVLLAMASAGFGMVRLYDDATWGLLAKQLQNRGGWEASRRYLAQALSRRLPHPLFVEETLRMQGIAAWHLDDAARGRAAFAELAKNAQPGRALEAKRWLGLF